MNRLDTPLWAYVSAGLTRGETEPVLATLEPLVEKHASNVMLRRAYVTALMQAHRYREAMKHLAWLNAREDGKDRETYHKYALAAHLAGEFAHCLRICDEAIAAHPGFSQLYALRGGTWQIFGEFGKMMDDCRKAVQLDPDNMHARYALSLRELMTSGLTEGFEGYNNRLFEVEEEPIPFFGLPSWEGENIRGKTLLLIWEQGVGDMIMFASFIPYLTSLGAKLIVTVAQKLEALFTRSFPECEIVVVRDRQTEEALEKRADYAVLMGHLIELCLPHYRPAQHPPYLRADENRAQELRQKYLAMHPDRPYLVGIAWHTTNPQTGMLRTIPLEDWRPIFNVPRVQCVSLQYNAGNHTLPASLVLDTQIDAYRDLDALAAQMMAMDEIITIQNATAHLAGALGVPTSLMLSSASDWRWGVHDSTSAWYHSVTILRQKEPLVWAPLMESAARALTARTQKRRM